MKYTLIFIVIAGLLLGGGWYWSTLQPTAEITSFDECTAAGYPVMESYPARCRTSEGETFVQDIGNELEKQDIIQVSNPRPGQVVLHQLSITGSARGQWFFEASFPVHLEDPAGSVIVTSYAQAQGEWMTESFVPFAATLTIPDSFRGPAVLVLEKDNPSGLPEHADALLVPVVVE